MVLYEAVRVLWIVRYDINTQIFVKIIMWILALLDKQEFYFKYDSDFSYM